MRWPWQQPHADPAVIAELEAENERLDEYIDSDGSIPYPDLGGDDVTAKESRELAATNERAESFVEKNLAATYDHAFEVAMKPLSAPPKKRELFKPPVLDDEYFAEKREKEQWNAMRTVASLGPGYSYASASYYGGGASHYGYGMMRHRGANCRRAPHQPCEYDTTGHCYTCGEYM